MDSNLQSVKDHAEKTGHSLTSLFQAAGVDYSQWWRWQKGLTSPNTSTLNKLLAVPQKCVTK